MRVVLRWERAPVPLEPVRSLCRIHRSGCGRLARLRRSEEANADQRAGSEPSDDARSRSTHRAWSRPVSFSMRGARRRHIVNRGTHQTWIDGRCRRVKLAGPVGGLVPAGNPVPVHALHCSWGAARRSSTAALEAIPRVADTFTGEDDT
jgi:hypothetical protein